MAEHDQGDRGTEASEVTLYDDPKGALEATRVEGELSYSAWGKRALARCSAALIHRLAGQRLKALARGRIDSEKSRTARGAQLWSADRKSGQMTFWPHSTDAAKVRAIGEANQHEGSKKLALGTLQIAVADDMDKHPGMSGADAWAAEGKDAAELEAAAGALEDPTGTDG